MRARAWVFTVNNWTEEECEKARLLSEYCEYLVYGKEVGKQGTPHLQGFCYFKNQRARSFVLQFLPRAWAEPSRDIPAAIEYCKKDGDFWEQGKEPKQGRRVDVEALRDEIKAGKRVDDIAVDDPVAYHQYGRTLSKIEDIVMRKKFRTEMTEGVWYIGESGAGKSHIVFDDFSPDTHYVYPYDNGNWCDGYTQQETVIFNEFRGQIPYSRMLELVDKWPCSFPRRGREPMPFLSKRVLVTSKIHPREIYKNLSENDSLDQLYRRFKFFVVTKNNDGTRTYTHVDPVTMLPIFPAICDGDA